MKFIFARKKSFEMFTFIGVIPKNIRLLHQKIKFCYKIIIGLITIVLV